ncbi:GNAT family N-acetyltransferase [Telmatocola sphagniphila]|uniref:GNAT family N-acetyltransferase n=1 Tax=Telmatocola sphagniphila TaxID=1123043 RepID=A0A8E6B3Y1_9BACT|nr:GNAT family N-acetyltransferase [Telmatocola sphagniphila]QVL30989.1 GNAT family N-acetyltransferase [Telmatocola sphagniphila]
MIPQFEMELSDPRLPEVAQLIAELSAEMAGLYESEDGSGHYQPEDGLPPRGIFLVGRRGNELVACGGYRLMEPGVVEIKRMYVRPSSRGLGYSRRILSELEARARQAGFSRTRLETGDRQPAALALYRGAGYLPVPPYGVYENNPHSFCFEKEI